MKSLQLVPTLSWGWCRCSPPNLRLACRPNLNWNLRTVRKTGKPHFMYIIWPLGFELLGTSVRLTLSTTTTSAFARSEQRIYISFGTISLQTRLHSALESFRTKRQAALPNPYVAPALPSKSFFACKNKTSWRTMNKKAQKYSIFRGAAVILVNAYTFIGIHEELRIHLKSSTWEAANQPQLPYLHIALKWKTFNTILLQMLLH